jgi:integrase
MTRVSRGKVKKRTWTWEGRKRTAYYFDVAVNGERERRQYPSQTEAETELDKFREEQRNPKPVETIEAAPALLTLAQAFDKFLALKARRPTAHEFRRIAEHLKGAFGETPLTEITAARISEYKATRLAVKRGAGHLTAAAVNRPLGLLRSLLRQAKKWKALDEVPEFEFEQEPKGVVRFLTPEEATRLLGACRNSRNAALADLVEFAMFTGVRRGEALGLEWENVDRSRGVVVLVKTKNGKPRDVQLSRNADATLARRWTPGITGLVFGSRNWNSFRQAWVGALKAAGIRRFRFHDLRHTTASWLVQQGRSLKEVKELLGHSDIAITLRYAHLAPDHLSAAVASLDGILEVPTAAAATPTATREVAAVRPRHKRVTRTQAAA